MLEGLHPFIGVFSSLYPGVVKKYERRAADIV